MIFRITTANEKGIPPLKGVGGCPNVRETALSDRDTPRRLKPPGSPSRRDFQGIMNLFRKACLSFWEKSESQAGMALIASLLALSILTLIGMTMMFGSAMETNINRNSKLKLLNLYASESAAEEARDRIKTFLTSGWLSFADPNKVVYITASPSIDPTSGDANSNPYFDPDYTGFLSVTLVPSDLSQVKFAWVKIIPKTETRAGYSLDNVSGNSDIPILFGYDRIQPSAKVSQYVNSGTKPTTSIGSPVFLITALAKDGAGYKQMVRTDIAGIPQPPLTAVFFSKDAISIDATVLVQGDDEDTTAHKNLNGVESQGNINITPPGANLTGTPFPAKPVSAFSYNIDSIIKTLKPPVSSTIEKVAPGISIVAGTYVGDSLNLGRIPSDGDISQPTYVDGPLTLSNSTGQGILIVNGNMEVTGTFTYYGLIVVKGTVTLNGGALPGIIIHGAIIASSVLGDQTSYLTGNVQIINNSYFIQKELNSLQYTRLAFREIF